MSRQYTSSVILRESRPRSPRLQGLGRSASAAIASAILPDNAWSELFELVVISTGGEESYAIRAKYALYSDDEITAGGVGTPGSEPGGASYFRLYHGDSTVLRADGQTGAQEGDVLAYDATNQRWYAKPGSEGGGVSAYSALSGKPSINNHELVSGNNTLANLGIASADHSHSGYAASDHSHTGVYAPADHTHSNYAASDHNHDSVYAAKNHTHSDYLTLSGIGSADVTVKSLTIPSTSIDGFLKIGQAYLWYDDTNDALCVSGSNGSSMDFYAIGDIGAGGSADGSGAFSWTPVLSSGVEIARLSINGGSPISVFAPAGAGGASSYNDLSGKPSINGHTLAAGDNTLATLGIAAASHTHTGYASASHTHDEYLTEADLSLAEVAYSGIAAAVEDYTSPTHSIKIGYYGTSLSSANYFAMYAEVNQQPVIKDMSISAVKALLNIPSTYGDLSSKPSINGHTLAAGNNTLATLGIAAANHTHSGYAASDHDHDGVYAAANHTHSGYAASDHDHNGVYAAANHNHDDTYAAKTHTHDNYLTLQGLESQEVTVRSLTIPSTSISGYLQIGQAYLWYDNSNGALCVSGVSGASMDFYATGDVGAGGSADGSGAFTWTPVLSSGIEIAQLSINGGSPISVFAPAGGGGVSSYNDLSGKPSINGHTLAAGNNTLATLGIAAANHSHSGVYAPTDHTHSNYAASDHDHDSTYAAKNHTHSGYATSNHNHDGVYAAASHTHSGYAASNHNHDGVYAAANHTHSGYAASDHNHDNAYAAKNHTHSDLLPLSAGSTKALTGDLYLGSHKIYFDSTHYLEYDSINGAFHFSADVYADGEITAS